jgi:hypothetical protein
MLLTILPKNGGGGMPPAFELPREPRGAGAR